MPLWPGATAVSRTQGWAPALVPRVPRPVTCGGIERTGQRRSAPGSAARFGDETAVLPSRCFPSRFQAPWVARRWEQLRRPLRLGCLSPSTRPSSSLRAGSTCSGKERGLLKLCQTAATWGPQKRGAGWGDGAGTRAASRQEGWPPNPSSRCLGPGCLAKGHGQLELLLSFPPAQGTGGCGDAPVTRALLRLCAETGEGDRGRGEGPFGQKPAAPLPSTAAGMLGTRGPRVPRVFARPVPAAGAGEEGAAGAGRWIHRRGLATISRAPGKLRGDGAARVLPLQAPRPPGNGSPSRGLCRPREAAGAEATSC